MAAGRAVTESPRIVPVRFRDAAAFVELWHRHHAAPRGAVFNIGAAVGQTLVAVACIGRPVARNYDDGLTLEVTRVASDGTVNACSLLYGASWRAARALGYGRLITYTRADEPGSSLRGAGWRVVAERPARPGWSVPSRPREGGRYDCIPRTLWEAS
jgi:hypothetical protein